MSGTADAMSAGNMSGTPQVLFAHQLKLPTVLRKYEKVAASARKAASIIRAICSA